jgi:hypothetical protein
MAGDAEFAVPAGRLAARRGLDLAALSRLAGVGERELSRGGAPSPPLLRRLAPALGLHRADLFAIAGVAVPEDLAPLDGAAGRIVPDLARRVLALPPQRRDELRRYVRALPQEERTRPAPAPPAHEPASAGPGALLLRMARNRNLGLPALARTLLVTTGRYWSAATYGTVGRGRTPLTPDLLAGFAAVLDVSAGDLAALTGVTPSDTPAPRPAVADVARLLWDVRRLTAGQLRQVCESADSLRR